MLVRQRPFGQRADAARHGAPRARAKLRDDSCQVGVRSLACTESGMDPADAGVTVATTVWSQPITTLVHTFHSGESMGTATLTVARGVAEVFAAAGGVDYTRVFSRFRHRNSS